MSERELENLKHLPVPEPRAGAKRMALAAAMAAFDASSQNRPQGSAVPLRQTKTSNAKGSIWMHLSTRPSQALAASIAALVIAAPFAFQQLSRIGSEPTAVTVASHSHTSIAPPASAVVPEPRPVLPSTRREIEALDGSGPKLAVGIQPPQLSEAQPSFPAVGGLIAPPSPPSPVPTFDLGATGGYAGGQPFRGGANIAAVPMRKAKEFDFERARSTLGAASIPEADKPRPYAGLDLTDEKSALERKENRDKFDAKDINPVKQVATEPVSTFSIDVDTASYSLVRRTLNAGHLPPKDAVRVEEMINYFPYSYPAPATAETPFKPTVTVMPSPWNPNNKLVHVAIKGYDLKSTERPRANLVLLADVSGSMEPDDRLPLVKNAFRLLVDQLKPDDTVGIVTYASGSGIALEPTKVSDKAKILAAVDRLGAGGSTAGAEGIADAYRLAEAGFDKAAVNRIILATDGDFNVGITDQSELKAYIERKRQSGIFLSILGVGQGNHNDALMQALAQNGNGTAAYADTLNEARKVLVDESSSTLFTIAKDVKAQIEWNPERVAEYRLVGYETRALRREDFNNDKVDAGDIGSGHTVTAIYEVTPIGAPALADDLRYAKKAAEHAPAGRDAAADASGELGFLKLRYKRPNEDVSQLITVPVTDALSISNFNAVPAEQRFSVAVAAFGQLLKGEPYTQGYTFDDVLALAQPARGDDPFGYRAEFLNLVRLAKSARP